MSYSICQSPVLELKTDTIPLKQNEINQLRPNYISKYRNSRAYTEKQSKHCSALYHPSSATLTSHASTALFFSFCRRNWETYKNPNAVNKHLKTKLRISLKVTAWPMCLRCHTHFPAFIITKTRIIRRNKRILEVRVCNHQSVMPLVNNYGRRPSLSFTLLR